MKNNNTDITFSDYCAPALEAGEYTIDVSQQLSDIGEIGRLVQKFFVSSPQFFLAPKDIHTHYPAHEAIDDFDSSLPYIVFTKRALPWERKLEVADTMPVPWLALLVFTEDEVSDTFTMTIEEYLKPERSAGEMKVKAIVPNYPIDFGIDKSSYCQCIELPVESFHAIAPGLSELPYLAHCRRVEMNSKAKVDMPHQGDFAIMLANRLPAAGKKNIVHLVSLQGCEAFLSQKQDSKDLIRLISLANWSFTSVNVEENDSFKSIVQNLIKTEDGKEHRLLRIPGSPSSDAVVRNRMDSGFVPVPFRLMDGRNSFAWYRGPLAPVKPMPQEVNKPFRSASAAIVFDEATGTFDLTSAAAWQLGRMIALSDPSFGPKIMDFRRKVTHELTHFFESFVALSMQEDEAGLSAASGDFMEEIIERDIFHKLDTLFIDVGDLAEVIHENIKKNVEPDSLEEDNEQVLLTSASEEGNLEKYMVFLNNMATGESDSMMASDDGAGNLLQDIDYPRLINLILSKFSLELKEIASWLESVNLHQIPFHYAIPHPELLPKESIRFFYVDENWWQAVHSGALSLGIHSSIDEAVWRMLNEYFLDPEKREEIQGLAGIGLSSGTGLCGLLLRSKLVKSWSGVEFFANRKGDALDLKSARKIGDDTLLMIFDQEPDELIIQLPKEGLRFSVSDNITLKHLQGDQIGRAIPNREIAVRFRERNGVIAIKELADAMNPGGAIGGAAFGLQLIDRQERFVMNLDPSK